MKTNKKFGHCLIILMAMLFAGNLQAQVMVGEETLPKGFSLLEISTKYKKGGLRLPHLTTLQRDSLQNAPLNATELTGSMKGLVIYNKDIDCIEFWTGTTWESICDYGGSSIVAEPKWFYMPSIVLDMFPHNTNIVVDLYDEYKKQFDRGASGSLIVGNPGAPASPTAITKMYAADELNYYVISYDNIAITIVSLTDEGVLTYKVDTSKLSEATHMNIAFVVK